MNTLLLIPLTSTCLATSDTQVLAILIGILVGCLMIGLHILYDEFSINLFILRQRIKWLKYTNKSFIQKIKTLN